MNTSKSLKSVIHSSQLELQKEKMINLLVIDKRILMKELEDYMRNGKKEKRKWKLKELNFKKKRKNYVN